jgi:hypothetical protein
MNPDKGLINPQVEPEQDEVSRWHHSKKKFKYNMVNGNISI